MPPIQDVNIHNTVQLISPAVLKSEIPLSDNATDSIIRGRELVKQILAGEDLRMIVVVGPCSIHDVEAARAYAQSFQELASEVADQLILIMRVYFEKPRTTVGWKGLINDPHLDGTFDVTEGLRMARRLLCDIAEMGVLSATEMLEPVTPQYIADLITVASIGARTTESPTHRQMASGLSMPVGYKNGTDGSLEVAINAMQAARSEHSFLGVNRQGMISVVNTKGNPWGHLILRGGRSGPNYSAESIADACEQLGNAGLPPRVLVDCSHANSRKDHKQQATVWQNVIEQRASGNRAIVGLMLESNLRAGRQELCDDVSRLEYGVSITDACIAWDETCTLIRSAAQRLRDCTN